MEVKTGLLTVAALFAEKDERQARERAAQAKLERKKEEELSNWKSRLDAFQVDEQHKRTIVERIKAAFERGESEIMLTSFPSSFCTDGGRAVANADRPPIIPPTAEELKHGRAEPEWLATLPAGAGPVYKFWEEDLKPGGFRFSARIINFPDGKLGDVGLFFSWPKNALEV